MKPKDVFGIIVRVFGLSLTIYALWYLAYGVATLAGLPEYQSGFGPAYFISGVLFLTIGVYLLRGAYGLVGFAYPTISNKKDVNSGEPNAGG